jgi:hypothetical protein
VIGVDIGRRAWGFPCPACHREDWVFLLHSLLSWVRLGCPDCPWEWDVDTGFRLGWSLAA